MWIKGINYMGLNELINITLTLENIVHESVLHLTVLLLCYCQGKYTDLKPPTWPGTIVTLHVSCLLDRRSLVAGTRTNNLHQLRVGKEVKGEHHINKSHLSESFSVVSILAEQGVHHRKDSESKCSSKATQEANPASAIMQ